MFIYILIIGGSLVLSAHIFALYRWVQEMKWQRKSEEVYDIGKEYDEINENFCSPSVKKEEKE